MKKQKEATQRGHQDDKDKDYNAFVKEFKGLSMGVETAIHMASKAAPLMRAMIKIAPGTRMNYTTFYAE
eukprot:6931451-Prorocentrum_lima.AAC.1